MRHSLVALSVPEKKICILPYALEKKHLFTLLLPEKTAGIRIKKFLLSFKNIIENLFKLYILKLYKKLKTHNSCI